MPREPAELAGRTRRRAWIALTAVWAAALVVGLFVLSQYKFTPGSAADAPARWPTSSALARATDRTALVFFAHPLCPCTRTSIDELESLLSSAGGNVDAHVVVLRYEEGGDPSETLTRVSRIPGVMVHLDDGSEAARFGARTSGQTLLYGADGRLVFEGGITAARGHAGDSVGKRRVTSLLRGGIADAATSSVFGCSLQGGAR
jgi:hypothetical protein